ncbi:MAG TPA: O-antigen ligase family protein [Vicinamibacterales bacterium]|nr:O-antigen ligase family protein [Vicinamibacterales bacterium]
MKGYLLVYSVVIIGSVVALRKPVLGLFLYIALSLLRPDAFWGWAGDLRGMSDLVAYPLLVGWAFQGFGSWSFGRGWATVLCLLLYTGWMFASTVQAIDPTSSWWTLVEFVKTLLPFLVGVTMIKTEKQARQLLWTIVVTQTYVCYEMNRSYLEGYNRVYFEGFGGMDNNSFAISLVGTVGAALGLFLSAKTWRVKVFSGLSMLLIMHTVLLTFSRGAFVGLLAVALMALVILPKRPKYVGAVVLSILIGSYFTGPELAARYSTTFANSEMRDESSESRFTLWGDMLSVTLEEPIFGIGPHNWPLVAENFGWAAGKEGHSLWVQTAAEMGLPGVSFLVLFYGITVARLWPIARRRRPDLDIPTAMFATGLILAIVGFVVSAQFVSLRGLELPFYVTMIGVLLLKFRPAPAPAPGTIVVAPRPPVAPVRPRPPLVGSS